MSVVVITAPEPIVTVAEARAQLRGAAGTDEEIASKVAAATKSLDGPAGGWLGRALGEQDLELTLDGFDHWRPTRLPFPPTLQVLSVKYDDTAGAEQTLDAPCYRLTPGGLALAAGAYWPTPAAVWGAVRIRYRAGYPVVDDKSTVPEPIREAILLLFADLWRNREAQVDRERLSANETLDRLLSSFRVYL